MIRKLLLVLALALCSTPGVLTAQAEWRVEGFSVTDRGFRGTLLFRNGQSSLDTPIRGIRGLVIGTRPSTPGCFLSTDTCFSAGNTVSRTGNIDTRRFAFDGGARVVFDANEPWEEDSCIGPVACSIRRYILRSGLGVLGCPVPVIGDPNPIDVRFYAGRTCAAEGFDGWFSLPFERSSENVLPPGFVWQASDLTVGFTYINLGTVNGFLVPEPASLVLLASGLVVLGVWRRRTAPHR